MSAFLVFAVWIIVAGVLWVLPNGVHRRGWTYERYGVLDSLLLVRNYRNMGEVVDFKQGEGFFLSVCITVLATIIGIFTYRWLVKHWYKKGYCFQCGYNLRASTSSVCPECGTKNHVVVA
jgi:hypothetical protein